MTSLLDLVKGLFTAMPDWTKSYSAVAWVIDISHWNAISESQLLDMKNHGLGGVWIQMCNGVTESGKFKSQAALCRKVGVPYAVYTWLIPNMDYKIQADAGLGLWKKYALDAKNWLVDIEQSKTNQIGDGTTIPPDVIYKCSEDYMNYVSARIGILPFGIYSGPGFVNYSCPKLSDLINLNRYFYVNASYSTNTITTMTWSQFADYLTHIYPATIPLKVPNSQIESHQFTSTIQIKNDAGVVYERLDFDSFQSLDVYKYLFSGSSVTPPIVIPPTDPNQKKVTAYVLTVRSQPDMSGVVLGYLKMGDIVTVNSMTLNNWSNITSPGSPPNLTSPFQSYKGQGWCSSKYLA